jgi:hypothetical protein
MSSDQGVFGKYVLSKASGRPLDPEACYFVLRLDKDAAARFAAMEYARHCDNRALADDLTKCVAELNATCSCGSVGDECARHPRFSDVWRAVSVVSDWPEERADSAVPSSHVSETDGPQAVTERDLVALLPGSYYMDPPDGGDVSLIEQLRRMAEDAARYRSIESISKESILREALARLLKAVEGKDNTSVGRSHFVAALDELDAAMDAAQALLEKTKP